MLKPILSCAALAAMCICLLAAGPDDKHTKSEGAKLSDSDAKFVTKAAQGGMTEVKLGELATTKGMSEDVKAFGARMVKDHGKANTELMELIATKGGSAPMDLDKTHQKHVDKLSEMSGADFDKAYVKMMVDDHKDTIDLFKKFAARGEDSDVKKWAAQTLPTLEEHYTMVQEMDKRMNGDKSAHTGDGHMHGDK